MTTGVLLMSYGTPRTRDDIESYYTHIRRGRPPTADLLAELTARYDAIGGSQFAEITALQVRSVAAELERRQPGAYVVVHGSKHAYPFIEDGVAKLNELGVTSAVGLVLAPHFSAHSVGQYTERAAAAAQELGGPPFSFVDSWNLADGYIGFLEAAVLQALDELPQGARAGAEVIFTAHSLPERLVLGTGDPYPDQLRETAAAVAERAQLTRYSTAWQSAGRTPEPWIGPDVLDHMADVVAGGATGVVVCPCGFVADHLEVRYDVDIECGRKAAELGVPFARTVSPNAEAEFVATVADVLLEHVTTQTAV